MARRTGLRELDKKSVRRTYTKADSEGKFGKSWSAMRDVLKATATDLRDDSNSSLIWLIRISPTDFISSCPCGSGCYHFLRVRNTALNSPASKRLIKTSTVLHDDNFIWIWHNIDVISTHPNVPGITRLAFVHESGSLLEIRGRE